MTLPRPFGKYTLLERLATGGMAELFLAQSSGLEGFHKRLVVKRILPALASDPDFVRMFIKEAGITAGLSHPNIVQIFDAGRIDGDPYIAMEYLHGRDLARVSRQLRRAERRMPIPLAVYITANLLRGLAYAHGLTDASGRSLDLVHRDVSPHNVLVSFQGEVKLLDFGIARLTSAEEQQPGRVGGGKYAYMSPEQAAGLPLDARSDLFSAGIVLYELLVGQRLFHQPNPRDKLRHVREAIIPDPRVQNPEIPDALWGILQGLLRREPDARYARAEAVEEDLWAFLFSVGWRADAAALSAFLRGLFPDAGEGQAARVDLEGLRADLERAAAPSPSDAEQTGSGTGTGASSAPSLEGQAGTGSYSLSTHASSRSVAPLKPGERRTVTVLVAELCGLTDISAQDDPAAIVRQHYAMLRRIKRAVDWHGGLLESFRDDVVVIFFGMERTRENDLERALACAASLQRQAQRGELGALLAVGVHVGELTVGSRSGRSQRYLARGDTMKLARRLCAEAEVGEVLVSERVARLAEGRYTFASAGTLRRRGGAGPVPGPVPGEEGSGEEGVGAATLLWRLEARRSQRHGPPGGAGRWLRRGEEPEILGDALRALGEGQGSLIEVQGEGGTGKTFLLQEFQRLAQSRGVPFFSAAALPYQGAAAAPLAPLRDLVASILGVEGEPGAEMLQEQLRRLAQLRLDEGTQGLIGGLFGLRTGRGVGPEDMQRAAAVLVRRLAEDQPVILALDDAQNLAPLGVGLIGHVIAEAARLPVLFLLTSRGPLPAALGAPRWRIRLGALDGEGLRRMAAEALGARGVQEELAWLLEGTTRGNPMHLSMVLRALQQAGQIEVGRGGEARLSVPAERLQLPPGVDGLIAARVDALDEPSRRFVQLAAVVGSTFSLPLVASAAGMGGGGEEVGAVVRRLVEQGLVAWEGEERQARFVTPLVWEVVRRSVVGNRLRQHHALVADAILASSPEGPGPHRAALAVHCAAAGRLLEAAGHALRAGVGLRQQGLLQEAAALWDQGIGWLEQAQQESPPPRDAQVQPLAARLWLHRGEVAALLGSHGRAERWLALAQELAGEVMDAEVEARASLQLGGMYRSQGREPLAQAHLEAALQASYAASVASSGPQATAEAAWRRQVAVEALEALGMLDQDRGETAEAARRFQLALTIAGDDPLLGARARMGLAGRHTRRGEAEAAGALLDEAEALAAAAGDALLLSRILNHKGIVSYGAQAYDEALESFRRSAEIRQRLGYRSGVVVSYHNIGDTLLRKGDTGRAWAAFQRSRDLARELGWSQGEQMNAPFLAFIEGLPRFSAAAAADEEAGLPAHPTGEEALGRMRAAVAGAEDLSDIELRVAARWLLGRLLGAHGHLQEARDTLQGALQAACSLEARPLVRDIEESLASLGR